MATAKSYNIANKFTKFSNWQHLFEAWYCSESSPNKGSGRETLTPEELQEAENFTIATVQTTTYRNMEREKCLTKLYPQLDNHTGLV